MSKSTPIPRDDSVPGTSAYQTSWLWVLALVGLDYFSTLGYQPSIAFAAAGRLAPLATALVVVVTLFGMLPVYAYVAGRSPQGAGATGLLERLVPGWRGKALVLFLLGFAATDFVFTQTLSAADAAEHLIRNPIPEWQALLDRMAQAAEYVRPLLPEGFWQQLLDFWDRRVVVTVLLLVVASALFIGFHRGMTRRVVQLGVAVVVVYLALNTLVIGSGLWHLSAHPDIVLEWRTEVADREWLTAVPAASNAGWGSIVLVCVLVFPKMALGLSGFELSMVLMPLVRGRPDDDPACPRGRIRNTRKLLAAAAVLMSVYLLGSTVVTSLLIPPEAIAGDGPAANRALAYLAHGQPLADGSGALLPFFGPVFGTLYDLSAVAILILAGTSVAIGLREFLPPYLHRLGMEMDWAHRVGAMLYVLMAIKIVVTVVFRASVEAQRGAYATSVLVLIASAALAVVIDRWQKWHAKFAPFSWLGMALAAALMVTGVIVVVARPEGVGFACWFLVAIFGLSLVSRFVRSTELRFQGFVFKDADSKFLWESLVALEFPVLVPHRAGLYPIEEREKEVRARHRLTADVPVVFVVAALGDPSDFWQLPLVEVKEEDGRFVVHLARCASIAHVIAAAALELSKGGKPPEIHFGWSDESPLTANLGFVFFGQGNVPWMVHELVRRAEPDEKKRPRVIIA